MIEQTLSLRETDARLPIRFRRQLAQAYRLAAISYPDDPLALIRFATRLARHVEQSDCVHARTCTDLHCPADEIDDQLMSLRRLLAMDDEPDLAATVRDVLAVYDGRRAIASHLGAQDTAAVIRTPGNRFRWRVVWNGVVKYSDYRYPSQREAEQALAAYLRG
jgi:hypothetical protein